jgi:hypothetical protein
VVEAESGYLARDKVGGAPIGAGQKWFPNGMYFGGPADMWKQDTERRGSLRVTTLRDATGSGPTRATAWANSAPTTGDWQPGDLVWNAAPAPNQPMGWICTSHAPLVFAEMPRLGAAVTSP